MRTAEVEIKLGDQYFGVTALVSDLKLKFCGKPVDGIIGLPLPMQFKQFVFDFANNQVLVTR